MAGRYKGRAAPQRRAAPLGRTPWPSRASGPSRASNRSDPLGRAAPLGRAERQVEPRRIYIDLCIADSQKDGQQVRNDDRLGGQALTHEAGQE